MEIERKFLVKEKPLNLEQYEKHIIKQGYISTSPTIRIRQSNELYYLTVKGDGFIEREEFEIRITSEQFENLRLKVETNFIEKTRYIIPIAQELKAELDIYSGHLLGLLTVEVEFSSLEESENFIPPSWFGKDVSLIKEYKNSNLSRK